MQNKVDYLNQLWQKAQRFYQDYYREKKLGSPDLRLAQIKAEIDSTGTYVQHSKELEYGARVAWRNSNRCVGRLFWKSLKIRDLRHIQQEQDVFEALIEHLHLANKGGKIRPYISIFRAEDPLHNRSIRLWNSKLIHYAGYKKGDQLIGDPAELEFTQICQNLGWQGKGTAFDVLPLVVQVDQQKPRFFEIPPSAIQEVPLEHPRYPWFADLGLKWYTVPLIADMVLEIGGLHYTCAPFNGWYMLTEIASRNLGDVQRYNVLPVIAAHLQLDTSHSKTLWKDRALLELTQAVLYSFEKHGVTLVDHHTATQQFIHFVEQEKHEGREVQADWAWIVPPMSSSVTPVFHSNWPNEVRTPNYFYNSPAWKNPDDVQVAKTECPFHFKSRTFQANSLACPALEPA